MINETLKDRNGLRPCASLTLIDGAVGAAVRLNPLPLARHGSAVRLEVLDTPNASIWALLDVVCRSCGADVSAHVLEAYRQARADAIARAAALSDS